MPNLKRVGTTYLPVQNVSEAADWYVEKIGAHLNFIDEEKAIVDLADQSFFLEAAKEGETANFIDKDGNERFSLTFEVDGVTELEKLRKTLLEKGVKAEEVEDRGHAGRNFVFYDKDGNAFDVWSELCPTFKRQG